MRSLKTLVIAGALAISAAGAAMAADLRLPPPPPMPEPVVDFGGWYLRGDVGVGILQLSDLKQTFNPGFVVPGLVVNQSNIGDQVFIGIGAGYQFNSWLRFDLTGEYRTNASYNAIASYNNAACITGRCFDNYSANVSSFVMLANGYVDLGTWYGITPYVGVGLGFANNSVQRMVDVDYQLGGYGFAGGKSQTNFAWALMAGLGYEVTPGLKLELGYRYLNLGEMQSGKIACQNTPVCGGEVQKFTVASQDIRLGMRWMLGGPVAVPPPPLVRKY